MARGMVKWFNPTKVMDSFNRRALARTCFVHISAVERVD